MSDTRLSLDGPWSFTTDPHDRGECEAWYERTSGFGRQVEVPSAWQLYGRDLLDYTGAAWYYRDFELPDGWDGRRIRLTIGASDYLTRAWLNGQFVGQHEGGYTPFAFDLTDHVNPRGTNHLVIRVYDPRDFSEIPHGLQGSSFTRVSGIWQGIALESRPHRFIVGVAPRTRLSPDRVEATIELSGPGPAQRLVLRALDHTGTEVAKTETHCAEAGARLTLEIPDCHRWSPDDPYLYELVAELGDTFDLDVFGLNIGVREIDAIDGRLYLNNQPLIIRGAVDFGYWPESLYSAPSTDEITRELRLAKEAGINVLRKHGKIEDPRYLDICDRVGMLIWAEAPSCARWTPHARRRFRHTVDEMLRRDYHRPSIIAWSLYHAGRGLEDAGDQLQPWLRTLHDEIAALDPGRPICTHAGGTSMRTDLLDEHHRPVLPEDARAWYNSLAGEVPPAGAPRLNSEFSLWGLAVSPVAPEAGGWPGAAYPPQGDESKWPLTAERNFERYKLAAVFEDLDNLAKLTQRRMTRGIRGVIESLRQRQAFGGYVGRAFADTEWDASGWLTYDRQPKMGFDEWATFNGPIVVLAEMPRRNLWCGEEVTCILHISNHSKNALEGVVQWGIDGADCDGELEFSVRPFQNAAIGKITFTAPNFPRAQATRLSLRLMAGGWEVNTNHVELTISPTSAGRVDRRRVAAMHLDAGLIERLTAQGFQVEDSWSAGLPILAGSLEDDVQEALNQGANVVFLAEQGARSSNAGFLSMRELPPTGSWERTASVHYIQWDLFPQLPLNTIMGWEMEDCFPQHVIPMGSFGQGARRVTSNQSEEDPANILAGYFEGWLGQFSASMLLQTQGHGHLLTTTLRLGSQYGQHPIATQLLNRLLTEAHLFEPRAAYQLET
jgi:hypothetical protein